MTSDGVSGEDIRDVKVHELTNGGHGLVIVNERRKSEQHQRELKRKLPSTDEQNAAKRCRRQAPIPAHSPFETMRVTKLGVTAFGGALNQNGPSHCTVQMGIGNVLTQSHCLTPPTTMDRMTPRPTRSRVHGAALMLPIEPDNISEQPSYPEQQNKKTYPTCLFISKDPRDCGRAVYQEAARPSSSTLVELTNNDVPSSDVADEYGLDATLEEDMLAMANAKCDMYQNHVPPSSLLKGWDQDSRSAEEYDPYLQHSPRPASQASYDVSNSQPQRQLSVVQEDLLDDDVDWNAVYTIAQTLPKRLSLADSCETTAGMPTLSGAVWPNASADAIQIEEEDDVLTAFVRPPFPDKVRDRSPVPGISSKIVLKTCFRIGHLISQATHCHQHHQDVIFELYARVTYGSREALARKQHFQFTDLFKDQQPYPAGILADWRLGSLTDRQSQIFVNTRAPKLCWCMCKLRRYPRASTGWLLEILSIRETTWAQIRHAKMILCGSEEEGDEKVIDP